MTRYKGCFCRTCGRDFHYLGIARHRSMHRDKNEDCEIVFSDGKVKDYHYSKERKFDG